MGFGGHDLVEPGVLREPVYKGNDGIPVEQQAFPLAGMGHIGQLAGRDAQMLGKDLTVSRRLVEHVDEIGVFKDVFNLPGGQQILHVLGDARGDAAPLAERSIIPFTSPNTRVRTLCFVKHPLVRQQPHRYLIG